MRLPQQPVARRLLVLTAIALTVAACGGGGSLEAACGDVVTEELDPTWTVHLLPNAPEPEYLTDPPTSGSHYGAEPVSGVVEAPLDGPTQVTVLEVGGVLVQYRPVDISEDDRARLVRLVDDGVVIAPGPDLPDPVVATAWQTKQACEGVALDTLSDFIEGHSGQGPGGDG